MSAIYEVDFLVVEEDQGRVDVAITKKINLGRAMVLNAIKEGSVKVNGSIILKSATKVKLGDHVEAKIKAKVVDVNLIIPEDSPLEIIYSDGDILVLNKDKGLVTHPGAGNQSGTLLNRIYHHFPQTQDLPKGGLVQRLDKNTSGLMVIALNIETYQKLVSMMQKRFIQRIYEAFVWGRPPEKVQIEEPIGRNPNNHRLRIATPFGRYASTEMQTLAYGRWGSLVQCKLNTGRTHQIRVHMKYLNYPICGDEEYGLNHPPCKSPIGWVGQALHAKYLAFKHPANGRELKFTIDPPAAWNDWIKILEIVGL